ncbi:MAG: RlmE family RNA methyltransferase [bacterium]
MSWKRKDHYFHKARQENLRARSVYKLEEIDRKFRLIKKGGRVLDLGCAPGSWSQYALSRVGDSGKVVGVDRNGIADLAGDNFAFIQGNLSEKTTRVALTQDAPYHCVLSDMAPDTSGTRFVDQARSLELCELAAEIAGRCLTPGGDFLCKQFFGPDSQAFINRLKKNYQNVIIVKPKATRTESGEIYLVARSLSDSGQMRKMGQ